MADLNQESMVVLIDLIVKKANVDRQFMQAFHTNEPKKVLEVLIDNLLEDIVSYGKYRRARNLSHGQLILNDEERRQWKIKIKQLILPHASL